MSESGIKSNEREAARLFERGVAAARGGQRRVAAGLLARAVQLNPGHELGWLWLSGVLDKPAEIAFCLRSALEINPYNQRAREGLAWLEQRHQIAVQPTPAPMPVMRPLEPAPDKGQDARNDRESWWVRWRHERREMSRARIVFWSVPILLLLLTLALHATLENAINRNKALAQELAAPTAGATARPALPAILQAQLPATDDARALAYLSALEQPRARLRAAVEQYRASTSQPGGSSVAHAAAARRLRDEVDASYKLMAAVEPPATLAQGHNSYLTGLEIERRALDDMLEFYNTFRVQFANRATLAMIDAELQFEHARALFETRRASSGHPLPQQNAR
jgi:hypothetical protein